jgi:hypothetical protein
MNNPEVADATEDRSFPLPLPPAPVGSSPVARQGVHLEDDRLCLTRPLWPANLARITPQKTPAIAPNKCEQERGELAQ